MPRYSAASTLVPCRSMDREGRGLTEARRRSPVTTDGPGRIGCDYARFNKFASSWKEAPHPVHTGCGSSGRPSGGGGGGETGVWTVSTPRVSDWAVPVPDWAELGTFLGEWREFKGGSPVRVPLRAHVSPSQRPFCALTVDSRPNSAVRVPVLVAGLGFSGAGCRLSVAKPGLGFLTGS